MKKTSLIFLALILMALLLTSLAACGDPETTTSAPTNGTTAGTTAGTTPSTTPSTTSTPTTEEVTTAPPVEKFDVNFDLNYSGSTGAPAKQTVDKGSKVAAPTAPTRVGYKFVEWNTKADGTGTKWDFATSTVTAATTLYVKWEVQTFDVTFDLNGATGTAPVKQTIGNGAKATAPTAPTRSGYMFVEWNTKTDGTGTTWDFATNTVTAATTLYAKWLTAYEVTFNLNGATGTTPTKQTVGSGLTATAPTTPPTKTDLTFIGWYTAATNGTKWNFTGNTVTANVTLYARFATYKAIPDIHDANEGSYTSASGFYLPVSGPNMGHASEHYLKVFLGNSQKVCTSEWQGKPIIFKTAYPVSVTGYVLRTANDNTGDPGRWTKSWNVYGSNDGTTWTVINAVTGDTKQVANDADYNYSLENASDSYSWFKFEFTEIVGMLQLSRIRLLGNYYIDEGKTESLIPSLGYMTQHLPELVNNVTIGTTVNRPVLLLNFNNTNLATTYFRDLFSVTAASPGNIGLNTAYRWVITVNGVDYTPNMTLNTAGGFTVTNNTNAANNTAGRAYGSARIDLTGLGFNFKYGTDYVISIKVYAVAGDELKFATENVTLRTSAIVYANLTTEEKDGKAEKITVGSFWGFEGVHAGGDRSSVQLIVAFNSSPNGLDTKLNSYTDANVKVLIYINGVAYEMISNDHESFCRLKFLELGSEGQLALAALYPKDTTVKTKIEVYDRATGNILITTNEIDVLIRD